MSNPYINCSSFFHAAKIQNILRKNAANKTYFRRTNTRQTSPRCSNVRVVCFMVKLSFQKL
jgi:hypothetical protein